MLKNDQNSEKSGGEGADLLNDPTATEITDEELNEHDGKDSDPLDAIADENARKEAKKARAITRRIAKAKANPPKKVAPPKGDEEDEEDDEDEEVKLPKNVATKDDLKTIATNGAKNLVPKEVLDIWDELADIPLGGFKPLDEKSIAENYIKRYNLYILDNPGPADNPATPLTVSVIQRSGGSKKVVPKQEGERELPGLKEPVPPEEWYK